ncbi:hypothetical protein [Bacteroides intestinalis]|nr:hypothetical protein [Bacteroides intestinalis]
MKHVNQRNAVFVNPTVTALLDRHALLLIYRLHLHRSYFCEAQLLC